MKCTSAICGLVQLSLRRQQSAQVVVWVAVMLPLIFLPIVGLAMDAGAVFDARRGLQNVADGAARVGAMQLDEGSIRGGGVLRIDAHSAHDTALAYVDDVAPGADPVVTAHADSVTVTLTTTVRPKFLSLLKVGPVHVYATAQARPCTTADTPTCQ